MEEDALCRRITAVKYDRDDSGYFTKVSSRPRGKNLWKKIGRGRENF